MRYRVIMGRGSCMGEPKVEAGCGDGRRLHALYDMRVSSPSLRSLSLCLAVRDMTPVQACACATSIHSEGLVDTSLSLSLATIMVTRPRMRLPLGHHFISQERQLQPIEATGPRIPPLDGITRAPNLDTPTPRSAWTGSNECLIPKSLAYLDS